MKFLLVIFLFTSTLVFSQTPEDESTEQKVEIIAGGSDAEIDFTNLLEKTEYFRNHPINLNKTNRETLEDFYLLNDLQINSLLAHIQDNGPLLAIQELQAIKHFDLSTIYNILPFVTIGNEGTNFPISFKSIFTEGKTSLFTRFQSVLEEARGFSPKDFSTNDTNRYLGSRVKIFTRMRHTYSNVLSIGYTGEKDAGEEFFKGSQKGGFDFNSFHIFYRPNKIIKAIAIGDYQVQYGQGLALWAGLAFGKSGDAINIKRNGRGLIPYTSVDENIFLRGAAISLGKNKFSADIFIASNSLDANVPSDSSINNDELGISSVIITGFHRTKSELENKNILKEDIAGTHLQLKSKNWNLGMTLATMKYNRKLSRRLSLYNQFEFNDDNNSNLSMDYSYLYRNIHVYGEIARSSNGGIAQVHGALVSLDPKVSMSLLYRNYQKNYQALRSNGFGENTRNANEKGFYTGINIKPNRYLNINFFYDQFQFPWLKYLVDAPSDGTDLLGQITYTPNRTFEAYLRYRTRNRPSNFYEDDEFITSVVNQRLDNYRFNIKYKISSSVWLANRVEMSKSSQGGFNGSEGFMVYQDLSYKPLQSKVSFNARLILFDAPVFDTRIYAFENDVLYAYSIPAYSGRGSRVYANIRYKIKKGIDCWIRYATTVFDDRSVIGSGLDEINSNIRSELKAQIRFEF
ncbi:MAG: hypothetical protein RIQ89_2142 [Bacteroidota bacterium]|jgi:hypothetical protein